MKYEALKEQTEITGWFQETGIWNMSDKQFEIDNISGKNKALLIGNEKIKNVEFSTDIIIKQMSHNSSIGAGIIFLSQDNHNYFWIGLGGQNKKIILGSVSLQGNTILTSPFKSIGDGDDLRENKSYNLKVNLKGNGIIEIYLDGGLALEYDLKQEELNPKLIEAIESNTGKIGYFVDEGINIEFQNALVSVQKWPIFVLTPTDNENTNRHFSILFESIINKASEEAGLGSSFREVDRVETGSIIEDILKNIDKSEIVVIVLTGMNPNVCFELGYSIAKNKKIILLCENDKLTNLPFNFRDQRILPYSLKEPSTTIEKLIGTFKYISN